VSDVPQSYFAENKSIFGRVERIIDGDTVRVRHCPSRLRCPDRMKSSNKPSRIWDSTLSIRIYGVDCPELQKRSTDPPSQPFAIEAKEYTTSLLQGKRVKVTLFSKDQYGRAIGKVETPRPVVPVFSRKDVSLELVRKGLATIYTGRGAEYGGNKDILQRTESEARKGKRGIWSQGADRVSPADFKRQQKQLKYAAAQADL
jgi:endonuclease YncB( thermonuclease family)